MKNVSNLLDMEYYRLKMLRVHSKCMGMMHHLLAQKKDLAVFLLDYQAKSWMVGRYESTMCNTMLYIDDGIYHALFSGI